MLPFLRVRFPRRPLVSFAFSAASLPFLAAGPSGCLYRTCEDSALGQPAPFSLPLDTFVRAEGEDGVLSAEECVVLCKAFTPAFATVTTCEAGPIVYPGGGSDTSSVGLDASVTITCTGTYYCG